MKKYLFVLVVLTLGISLSLLAQDQNNQDDDKPCGLPPKAKPQRIKGGESVPPLPLPATPLRRTERKRDPALPTLIGKLAWGQHREQVLPDGRKIGWDDWNTDPSDIQTLVGVANDKLQIRYRNVQIDPATFSWDPTEIPIVYLQGHRAVGFSDAERQKMREYVLSGGYIWASACHGSTAFANSFRAEMNKIFPDRPMVVLAPDHPVYRSSYQIQKVDYSPAANRPDKIPIMEGIYVGCRTAVFLFPYDVCCAWDSFHVPEGGKCIVGESAMQLGVNLVAYSIAYFNLGRHFAERQSLDTQNEALKGDFVFAQIKTNGYWDPDPAAFATLLKSILSTTNMKVNFGRKDVSLTDPNLTSYPFLYLTGHGDFTFTDEEAANLQKFLSNGGFLLADACCGNLEFDHAFRREIKRALPKSSLEEIPLNHPIFSSFYQINRLNYSTQVRISFKDLNTPYLEGISIGDNIRVVYSRFHLGFSWEGEDHAYAYGVPADDALKLGTNIIMYALTH